MLRVRNNYPDNSLGDLYDRLTMPNDLLKPHQTLDKSVDLCYIPSFL
ncbi:type IIL restriction-modification enzyme MmeI [Geminocystis herdmanii]|nr:type IIL restriction-modification enzyme MmeI [Geminocystis herdmanii]